MSRPGFIRLFFFGGFSWPDQSYYYYYYCMMCVSRYIYDTPIPVTKESIVIIQNYIYIYSNSKCTCTYILTLLLLYKSLHILKFPTHVSTHVKELELVGWGQASEKRYRHHLIGPTANFILLNLV